MFFGKETCCIISSSMRKRSYFCQLWYIDIYAT